MLTTLAQIHLETILLSFEKRRNCIPERSIISLLELGYSVSNTYFLIESLNETHIFILRSTLHKNLYEMLATI